MKKTVLIPTDFTIESLKMVKSLLSQSNGNYKYDVVLLHGVYLADSITDFIFFSKTRLLKSLTNHLFEEACVVLKNKFMSQLYMLRKDVFTGGTQAAFDNYLLANNIAEIYIPAHYPLVQADEKSFDLLPFIRKSEVPVHEIEWEVKEIPEQEKLAEIFFETHK